MLAGVYRGVGSIECRETATPTINKNEALVRVRAAAICGTDMKIYTKGHFAIREGEERILGHEFSGEIVELGKNVRGYKVGMRVGVEPNIGCGRCSSCRKGLISLCPEYICFGITIDGAFAEFVKINEMAMMQGNMIPFSENTDFDEAALAEPLACCYNGYQSVKTGPGDYVVIIGAGPIGILHLQLSKLAGARKVMIADISDERLGFADKFGPDIIINTNKEDLIKAVMKHTRGNGADVVITACPVPEIQAKAVLMAAKKGRICLFGGLPKGKETVEINTNIIHYNSLVLTGTTGSSVAQYEKALELITDKKIDTKSLVSKQFGIEEIKEAFEYALRGKGLKTVIEFMEHESA
jgi:L-iditol 2-dehydrogenase